MTHRDDCSAPAPAQTNGWGQKLFLLVSAIVLTAAFAWIGADIADLREQITENQRMIAILRSDLSVIASEKMRNEGEIADLKEMIVGLQTGRIGDRYPASHAMRDFALRDQRLDWLEENCVFKK